nr:MAG TPA: hypothetical protein [Inoviridae sp.]
MAQTRAETRLQDNLTRLTSTNLQNTKEIVEISTKIQWLLRT